MHSTDLRTDQLSWKRFASIASRDGACLKASNICWSGSFVWPEAPTDLLWTSWSVSLDRIATSLWLQHPKICFIVSKVPFYKTPICGTAPPDFGTLKCPIKCSRISGSHHCPGRLAMIHLLEVQLITSVQDATCRVNFKQFEPWAWSWSRVNPGSFCIFLRYERFGYFEVLTPPHWCPCYLTTKQVVPWSFYKHNVNFQPTSGDTTNKNMNLIEMGRIQYGISSQLAKRDTTIHNPHVSMRLHTTPLCYMSQVSRVSPFHWYFFKSPEEVSRHLVISRARQWLPTGSHW